MSDEMSQLVAVPRNRITVAVDGRDENYDMDTFGISIETSDIDIIRALAPAVREDFGVDITSYYKVAKARNSGTIYIIPNSTAGSNESLAALSNEERLAIYDRIVAGCQHVWSKGKVQEDKLKPILNDFMKLAESDPEFLAKFTSYAMTKLDSKDLKVVSVFANFLNDADGTPFSAGSKYRKPNWRLISSAAVQMKDFDAKMVERLLLLAGMKGALGSGERFKDGAHFPTVMKTALKKYLKFREANLKALEGVKKTGLGNRYKNIYRKVHLAPSVEAASILKWKQKDGRAIDFKNFFNFDGLSDLKIAEKIRRENLSPTGVLGALKGKISPVVAAAVLEQASGDQAVILRSMFDEQGLLKDKSVAKVFEEKIMTAKTALDRVERINTEVDGDVTKMLKKAKSAKRKADLAGIGKVFLHIDISSSLSSAIDAAKDKAAIIAECVPNPEVNFKWGTFNTIGTVLKNPDSFEKDAFVAALYGVRASGSTNCLALYNESRRFGADVDVFITDGGHNCGDLQSALRVTHAKYGKPRAVVVIKVGSYDSMLERAFVAEGVSVTALTPAALTESALVTQAVKVAMKGRDAIIDEIMETPLLKLPQWWAAV